MVGDKLHIPGPDDEGSARSESRETLSWEFVLDFREMVRELERRDDVVDVEWQIGDPVPTFTVETIEHGLGTTIPRFVKRLYRLADGLHLEWSLLEDGERKPGGGIGLFDFATVFDSWLDELWTSDPELDPSERDLLWSLRGFDARPQPDGERMVAVCVEDVDYPTFDLFLHDLETRRSHLLELDFQDYLRRLLETRGTYGWVHHFADLAEDDPADCRRRQQFRRRMARLFPEVDLEAYRASAP